MARKSRKSSAKPFPAPHVITDSFHGGRRYDANLAAFHGDPEAVVDGKSEVKRLLHKRGWGCEALGIEPRVAPPPERYEVAPDIVEREVQQIIARDCGGKMDPKKRRELAEAVKEKRSGAR